MIGGKINNVFTVLLYENGDATENITAGDRSNISLKIKSTTKFPSDGKVEFVISPSESKTFRIEFRVPKWSANFVARVGDKTYSGQKGAVLSIERKWKAGDKVSISFDMPVQVIPGGLSYPNAFAIKRGPQVLAIDQGLNPQISSLENVVWGKDKSLTNADASLPVDWDWKEAYSVDMEIDHLPQKVIIVPFSEAGQKTATVEVWIKR